MPLGAPQKKKGGLFQRHLHYAAYEEKGKKRRDKENKIKKTSPGAFSYRLVLLAEREKGKRRAASDGQGGGK